jgi:hypothetical protein
MVNYFLPNSSFSSSFSPGSWIPNADPDHLIRYQFGFVSSTLVDSETESIFDVKNYFPCENTTNLDINFSEKYSKK